jgi:ribonuclease BN (tRNA processing enzyme)
VEAANGADLFICEAYSYDKPIPHHLSYATLRERRDRLDCKRLILTHLGPEMLGRAVDEEVAEDGLVLTL